MIIIEQVSKCLNISEMFGLHSIEYFDTYGRNIYRKTSDSKEYTTEYDDFGNVSFYKSMKPNETYWYKREYDEFGNMIRMENSRGYWGISEYNELGFETFHENSSGYWCITDYDDKGNQIYFRDSDGIETIKSTK